MLIFLLFLLGDPLSDAQEIFSLVNQFDTDMDSIEAFLLDLEGSILGLL